MFDLLPSEKNIGEDMAKIFEEMKSQRKAEDNKEFERMMTASGLVKKSKWAFTFVPRDIRIGINFNPLGVEINLPMLSITRDVWWVSK